MNRHYDIWYDMEGLSVYLADDDAIDIIQVVIRQEHPNVPGQEEDENDLIFISPDQAEVLASWLLKCVERFKDLKKKRLQEDIDILKNQ